MTLLRSRRFAAILLAVAAAIGLLLANTAAHDPVEQVLTLPLGWRLEEWLQDGLLALFYLVAGIELRHEFQHGSLSSPSRAAVPAIAAAGGITLAIALYLVIAPHDQLAGWPVPTATDIAFSVGVLSMFGHERTGRLRAFLLALAVVNDIVGLCFVTVVGGFDPHRIPTLAAAAIGLAIPIRIGSAIRLRLEPWVNAIVLPLFAIVATFVPVAGMDAEHGRLAFSVAVSLVVGQFLGIAGAGWLASRLLIRDPRHRLGRHELVAGGALGGIGFTVSLLLARLAFRDDPPSANAAVLGVLAGSIVAIALASTIIALGGRSRRGRDGR